MFFIRNHRSRIPKRIPQNLHNPAVIRCCSISFCRISSSISLARSALSSSARRSCSIQNRSSSPPIHHRHVPSRSAADPALRSSHHQSCNEFPFRSYIPLNNVKPFPQLIWICPVWANLSSTNWPAKPSSILSPAGRVRMTLVPTCE